MGRIRKLHLRTTRLFLPAALFLLTSCTTTPRTATVAVPAGMTGMIHGGEQPISGVAVYLYAVGTTGDGSASQSLLTTPVTTDGGGNFSLTGDYTCSPSNELVYLVGLGGDASPGIPNPQIALMAALGPCNTLTSSTFIDVNELTTVAAVYALAPYMTGPPP